ncbi:hypothetical protein G6F68_021783 [Rhizopus microsporus]|nr:hypothetical protein G6F68_021783 [Rhizopus microsporus]
MSTGSTCTPTWSTSRAGRASLRAWSMTSSTTSANWAIVSAPRMFCHPMSLWPRTATCSTWAAISNCAAA